MRTATEIREKRRINSNGASQRLYRLSEPLEGNDYVVVSAATVRNISLFKDIGPETYIFGADKDGDVLDWMDLPGSFQGDLDHVLALNKAGYKVIE